MLTNVVKIIDLEGKSDVKIAKNTAGRSINEKRSNYH